VAILNDFPSRATLSRLSFVPFGSTYCLPRSGTFVADSPAVCHDILDFPREFSPPWGRYNQSGMSWRPEVRREFLSGRNPLDVVNTGQTEKGFFVVEVFAKHLRLGYHLKQDAAVLKNPEWTWKYLFEKPIKRPMTP